MNHELKNVPDQNAVIEIDEAELETLAATLQVRSGLRAGRDPRPFIPCI